MEIAQVLTNSVWGKVIRSPLRLLPTHAVVPVLTGALRGKRWIIGSQRHACWMGVYESRLQTLIAHGLRENSVFYDIGANAGFYTLLAGARIVSGMVVAFEPLPENVAYLRRHIELNHLRNVRVIEAAVSDSDGASAFEPEITRGMGRLSEGGILRVDKVALDTLIFAQGLIPPTHIKMDIEGEELRALFGARNCFSQFRPELFLATHGKTVHDDCCRVLSEWNYVLDDRENVEDERGEIHAMPVAV